MLANKMRAMKMSDIVNSTAETLPRKCTNATENNRQWAVILNNVVCCGLDVFCVS